MNMSNWKIAVPVIGAWSAGLSWLILRTIHRVHMMPVSAAREAEVVDHAFHAMVLVTVPIFAIVASVLIYSLVFFRASSDSEQGERIKSSRGFVVELLWVAASVVLTLGLAAFGSEEFLLLRGDGAADLEVSVRASQWSWEFHYPDQDVVTTALILPKGKRVRILLTSEDVVHSFWVPAFRVKQDALPHKVVQLLVTPTRVGEYDLVCAELCGLDHALMRGKVRVVEADEFQAQISGESW